MKILLGSHVFSPSVGGIETCSLVLAKQFRDAGHDVRVLTTTESGEDADDHGFDVLRKPSRWSVIQSLRWSDVFFQNNISLQTAWLNILVRRPWVVTTATWLAADPQQLSMQGRLKRWSLRWAHNLYISQSIADHVGHPGTVIGNPYDNSVFRRIPGIARDRDLVFLGRLVSDKGCDLLIQALATIRRDGVTVPTATIIGDGPELVSLKQQVSESDLRDRVRFAGCLAGENLAGELNRHRVMVIPSRWNEPFGIVALEGMACGCMPVVSSGGGLPEATGGHGFVFSNGNAQELTRSITEAMSSEIDVDTWNNHLQRHLPSHIARRYLEEFARCLN